MKANNSKNLLEPNASTKSDAGTKPGIFVVRRRWQQSVLTFLMVFGPGLIVMEADNDAGAVSTYVQAGGTYGRGTVFALTP